VSNVVSEKSLLTDRYCYLLIENTTNWFTAQVRYTSVLSI